MVKIEKQNGDLKKMKKLKKYKAIVRCKKFRNVTTIVSKYYTKTEFINDLRKNGYIVYNGNITLIK